MNRLLVLLALLAGLAVGALAQDGADEGDGGFIANFLQTRISGPGREIRLQGLSGTLSSQVRIARLTVSDDKGVWLAIDGVEMDWTRLALLRGRLSIDRLAAQRIDFLRRPVPSAAALKDRLPNAAAQPFKLPELPVQVRIAALDLARIDLAAAAVGQAAQLAATGSADLARGALDAALNVRRLDGPGGELALDLDFSNDTNVLDLDLHLSEPAGGVVATLLDIENRPALDLRLKGGGPLDDLDLAFSFDADAARIATGSLALRATPEGRGFTVDFAGGLAPVMPPAYRQFFAGETSVEAAGVALDAGGFRVDRFAVAGAEMNLTGALATAPDGFPEALTLSGRLGDPQGPAVTLPVGGGGTSLRSAALDLSYGQGQRWTGVVTLDRLAAGEIAVEEMTLNLGGRAENLADPATRDLTFAIEGVATGVSSANPDVAAALGGRLDLFVDAALPPGGPLKISQAQATSERLSLFAAGDVRDMAFDGRLAAKVADLAPVSGLAGRDLSGGLDLKAEGALAPLTGAFDLALDGSARDLRLGLPALDGLLQGATTLGGRVARDASGFRTEGFRLANPQVDITSDGRLTPGGPTDLGVDLRLADLAAISPRLGGAATATGRATGSGGPIDLVFEAAIPEGRLADRALTGARLGFDGTLDGANLTGAVRGGGALDDQPITVAADLALVDGRRSLGGLSVGVGPNALTGALSQDPGAAILGALKLVAPDLSPIAALALTDASGAAEADLAFAPSPEGGQGVTVRATARDVVAGGARVGALDLDAAVSDAFAAPLVQGTLGASDLVAGGVEVARLDARATQTGPEAMRVDADARLAIGTEAHLAGALARRDDGLEATLEALSLRQQTVEARLTAPATVTVQGDAIRLTPLALDLAGGTLTAEGTIAETFDVSLVMQRLPLSLANLVQPALGFAGQIDGQLRVTGPRAKPDIAFDVAGDAVASAQSRAAGLPPAHLTATGRTQDGRLALDARIDAEGLQARASGTAPLGAGPLDLSIELAALPLNLLDRVAGHRGLGGTVSGSAKVGGTTAQPDVRFGLRGAGITAQPLAGAGVSPLTLAGRGEFVRNVLTLGELTARNDQGLDLRASGRAPLQGPGLDLRVAGEAPLTLANGFVSDRAAQASGTVRLDLTAAGSLAQPRFGGSATIAGATINDPMTNIRLQDVSADIGLDGQTVVLRSLSAASAAGGTVTGSGTVSLAAGNPADLALRFNALRYTDGSFVSTTIDGELRANGPLRGAGEISGRLDLGRTEISIAEGLGGNALQFIEEVRHVDPPPGVAETLRRARLDEARSPQASPASQLTLNVRLRAPNQIFVRGRGLDVELGGEMRLTGRVNDLTPVGEFELRRGRLEILGQRIEFTRGRLTLTGNFNPMIDFEARIRAQDVTAIVSVTGRVTAPEIRFSSEPPLPEDEVLARVIFNRSVQNLSPFQIAQLAAAAAELAGGGSGGPGILDQLRSAIGFDDLEIVTEDGGETALRAGTYIDDDIYLDVQTDTTGEARAQINLDVTKNLTLRGSVGSGGNSTIGVFFEREY